MSETPPPPPQGPPPGWGQHPPAGPPPPPAGGGPGWRPPPPPPPPEKHWGPGFLAALALPLLVFVFFMWMSTVQGGLNSGVVNGDDTQTLITQGLVTLVAVVLTGLLAWWCVRRGGSAWLWALMGGICGFFAWLALGFIALAGLCIALLSGAGA